MVSHVTMVVAGERNVMKTQMTLVVGVGQMEFHILFAYKQ